MNIFSQSLGEKKEPTQIQVLIGILVIVGVSVIWKMIWLQQGSFPFNSDEAITGLMAKHILAGSRPVFFYGQSYMGSLDAYLIAGFFKIFGDNVFSIRYLQIFLYSLTIITTVVLGKSISQSWRVGLMAGTILAIPSINTTLYTTVSLGGYGEALLISNLIYLSALQLRLRIDITSTESCGIWGYVGLLGFLCGLGFWVLGITLVSSVPAVLLIAYSVYKTKGKNAGYFIKMGLVFLIFFIIGSIPWWIGSLQLGLQSQLAELGGSAIAIDRVNWFTQSANHLLYFIFLGLPAVFSFRPPWEVRWLAIPLLPLILMVWVVVTIRFVKLIKLSSTGLPPPWGMLIISMVLLTAGFVFTPFGMDPSGRYFLPMVIPFSLIFAWVLDRSVKFFKNEIIILGLVIIYHAIGTWQCAVKFPPGITTQFDKISWIDHRYDDQLMDFLRMNGETRGYTNYWVAYPLAFLSNEEILFSPRLPYHADLRYTSRDDRIPAYTEIVNTSPRIAYITTFNPNLDKQLVEGFRKIGVSWKEEQIGDFHIYYQLSNPVHPEEISLGMDAP